MKNLKKAKKLPVNCHLKKHSNVHLVEFKNYEADRFAVIELGVPIDSAIAASKRRIQRESKPSGWGFNREKKTFKSTHPLWEERLKQFEELRREVELNKLHNKKPKPINWKQLALQYLGQDLFYVVNSGEKEKLKKLIKLGVDLNIRDPIGYTTLMVAVRKGDVEIAQDLINANAGINVKNERGETALMLAAYNGHTEIAKKLIEDGADVNIKNNEGKTALDIAKEIYYPEIVELLEHK